MALQSKNVLDAEGRQYHTKIRPGDIGEYVLLPGDPFRTDRIARRLENPELVAHNREHKIWTGMLDGVRVSVASTGMGGGSAAIAAEELIHCGAKVLLRVGTCGRICRESFDERLEGCIITGAVRQEGATRQYVPVEYPAMADRHVVEALVQACRERGYCFAEGIAQSKDAFYGQLDPDSMPSGDALQAKWRAWEKAGVMASEMECAAVFIVSQIRGVQAGAVMAYGEMNEHTVELACEAIRHMIRRRRDDKAEDGRDNRE